MRQRSSAPARAVAALALICGFLVVAVVVAISLGGDGDDGPSHHHGVVQHRDEDRPTPKSYVVQNGDTLTSIAHQTGVPVARIVALNPGIDPQILVSGEKLKLR